ncbi:DUF2911 domain-containing protein [Aurantibacter crassamenti]|uniref:DUF2911 domain-containing protein n=1 Tax=Aurantibacter crassamenti TaxID=1837375 RepID=UPI0019394C19|nr:DUF2911 domain-containing protein [Aurantibacter crassamenti]MBM1106229.1 DUF2911 domain-containing protein [Aurantibacter crassamenti]
MKNLLTIAFMAITLAFSTQANAQSFNGLDKSPADIETFPSGHKNLDKSIKVVYSRPQLKGRSVSELAKAGEVWRTGANEAVEITFYKEATISGTKIAAGTYSLFSIPGDADWTIILNKSLNQWGAYSYDKSADVVRAKAIKSTSGESLEAFSIVFEEAVGGTNLILGWGTTRVSLPIKI